MVRMTPPRRLRRSPRFSGGSNAPPQPPLSPPPPYPFATPEQTMAFAMSNDAWSVEAHHGSDDEEEPAPIPTRVDAPRQPKVEDPEALLEMVPELPQELRPIRRLPPDDRGSPGPSHPKSKPPSPSGGSHRPLDRCVLEPPSRTSKVDIAIVTNRFIASNYHSKSSLGKRQQTSDDHETQDDDDDADESPRKRARRVPPNIQLSHENPQPTSNHPDQHPDPIIPHHPFPYQPVHRSAFPTVPSLKRTFPAAPIHARSSNAGVKRAQFSLPEDHREDHSSCRINQQRAAVKAAKAAERRLAAMLNPNPKPPTTPNREIIERTWRRVHEMDAWLNAVLSEYETKVLEKYGLDLALIRRAYIIPEEDKWSDERYQWRSRALNRAYPPIDHPAWHLVPLPSLLAWASSDWYRLIRPFHRILDHDAEIRAAIVSAPGAAVTGFNCEPIPMDDDEEEQESVAGPSGTSHVDVTHPNHGSPPPSSSPTDVPSSPDSSDSEAEPKVDATDESSPPPAHTPATPLRRTGGFYGSGMYQRLFGKLL